MVISGDQPDALPKEVPDRQQDAVPELLQKEYLRLVKFSISSFSLSRK